MAKAQELSSKAAERNATSNQEGRWDRNRDRDRDWIRFWDGDSNRMWNRDRYGPRDGHWVGSGNGDCDRMGDSYWVRFRDGHWVRLGHSHRDVAVHRYWDRLRDRDWAGHSESLDKITSGLATATVEPGDRNVSSVTYDLLNLKVCDSVSFIAGTPCWTLPFV
jgi:hypothetical protein